MSLSGLCNATGTIKRSTNTTDAVGGIVKAFAAIYSAIPITTQPANGRIQLERSKPQMEVDTVHYTPTAISLLVGDRVEIGSVKYIVRSWSDQAGRGEVFAIYSKRID